MAGIERRATGYKLSADRDWNPLVDAVTRVTRDQDATSEGNLFAESTLAVPVYSLLEIDGASTLTSDETPVVKVKKPTSGATRLATNGNFEIAAGKTGPIELISAKAVKLDVDSSDTGFVVGETCGSDPTTYQVTSSGSGLICLSEPITYETSKKYVWCCADTGGGVAARLFKTPSGGIPAASGSGPYTFGSAVCTPVSDAGVVGSGSETISNIVDIAIAGNVVIKAAKVGSIWVVDVASCGS